MNETATQVPVRNESGRPDTATPATQKPPFENLRREIDRLFDDFTRGSWLSPVHNPIFTMRPFAWQGKSTGLIPAMDIAEKEHAYEITAELPGLDQNDVEVKVANGVLRIRGEKQESREEKRRDYHLQERRYGEFERSFTVPDNVEADRIEANFRKGILTVMLPKKAEARKPEKTIEVKAE